MDPEINIDNGHLLHVHDLPQLYTRPSFDELSKTLDLLQVQPTSFSKSDQENITQKVDPEGVPRYLTSIISSSLPWLDEAHREQIWEMASARLSERCGRSAMPSMTRSFQIDKGLTINLFEPSLTEDNLGLKTWTSSLLLARRLPSLRRYLPQGCERVLELGSGTGLVGIAAGVLWGVNVVLTDLLEIVTNLQVNVDANMHLLEGRGNNLEVRVLDWSDASILPQNDNERFSLIIAADSIYSSKHPRMLVDTIMRWIKRDNSARFMMELPLRKGYEKERTDLREKLITEGMGLVEEGTEVGYDDWQGADGRPAEVECWWSVWRPIISSQGQSIEMQNHDIR